MKTRIIITPDSDEIMIHWPNGTVQFVSIWRAMIIIWAHIRSKKAFSVEDKDGEFS